MATIQLCKSIGGASSAFETQLSTASFPLRLCPQCSYVPPCERDNQKNKDNVLLWEDYFTKEVSSQSFTCFFNQQRRPDDVLWQRSHDTSVLLHCVLWPMVSLLLGTLIVLLTVCARSLAVRAEALQKRKCSYEVCQDLSITTSDRRGNKPGDLLATNSDPELSSPSRTLPLFEVPVRRRDREH
ncbi:PREDICTED: calcium-activated potassium channel subunit beta-4-like [Poecilia mexicana]|uniref:calcium-activated potassium channel subunit beta-4-like n=1 Tax=Poecilia mexicana TaxID=48701 RepID=UPI00072E58A7|nr:PREDICTED: calcium-activated potassium channel subunit beta-4-like [Poecilia mexicana]